MKVVIDTNVFCADYSMKSGGFRVLVDGLSLIPAQLVVPEVVVDEVVNRFREDLETAVDSANKSHESLVRMLGPDGAGQPPKVNIQSRVGAYRGELVASIEAVGGRIAPYPDVPHKRVVERDLARKKPFKQSGAGYRDYLIWETIRRLNTGGQDRLVFITANTRDFGDGAIAPDLAKDVINPQRIELFPSLKAFNEEHIVPRLSMEEEIRDRLQQEAGSAFDIPAWVSERLVDILGEEDDLAMFILGFPQYVGSVKADEVVSIDSYSVKEVRRLSGGDVLVRVSTRAEVIFDVSIDWDDYVEHEEVRAFVGPEDEAFGFLSTTVVDWVALDFNLVLTPDGTTLVESELSGIDGPSSSAQWGSW